MDQGGCLRPPSRENPVVKQNLNLFCSAASDHLQLAEIQSAERSSRLSGCGDAEGGNDLELKAAPRHRCSASHPSLLLSEFTVKGDAQQPAEQSET